jgi:hypothetical protein
MGQAQLATVLSSVWGAGAITSGLMGNTFKLPVDRVKIRYLELADF